jgi:hypothetical protein
MKLLLLHGSGFTIFVLLAVLLVTLPSGAAPEESVTPGAASDFQEGPAGDAPGADAAPRDPNRDARIRNLEAQLAAAQRAILFLQGELEALKKGEPSPLPQPAQAATPVPTPREQAAPSPPPSRERETLAAAEEEAPAPDQELPEFTPGFLREARAVLIRDGLLEIDPRLTYFHDSLNLLNVAGLDVLDNLFFGTFEIGKVKRDQLRASVSFRYGVTDRLQLNAEIPYVHTWSRRYLPPQIQRFPNEGQYSSVDNGTIGDITFGFSYHLWRESQRVPDIILTTSIKTDTGDGPFDVGPAEASTGTGFWGGTVGLTFVKVTDPGVLFANVGYFYHHEDKVRGFRVDPADSVSWGLGYSWSLNPFLSFTTSVNGRFVEKTEFGGELLDGSEETIANLSLGLTHAWAQNRSYDVALTVGLTEDSPDFGLVLSMPFTFNASSLMEAVF